MVKTSRIEKQANYMDNERCKLEALKFARAIYKFLAFAQKNPNDIVIITTGLVCLSCSLRYTVTEFRSSRVGYSVQRVEPCGIRATGFFVLLMSAFTLLSQGSGSARVGHCTKDARMWRNCFH